jgi:hypothetical protein
MGHIPYMGEKINAFRVLIGKPKLRWDDMRF